MSAAPGRGLPLKVAGLSVGFAGDTPAGLFRIGSLDLEAGGILGITGPSGAGKSSLLACLTGLLPPDTGSVHWGGADLYALGERRRDAFRRRRFGLVFQNFHLLAELSPLENVLLPARFDRFGLDEALRVRARMLLQHFGVPVARRRAGDLSRGEQQRLAMARALLLEPDVLLADEPTASLDSEAAATLVRELFGGAAEGRSLVVVSHDPLVLARCPRILTLRRGAEPELAMRAAA